MLVPVWSVSPYLLTGVLPAGQKFDAVIVIDAESTSLQAVLPAIARARQVIAFGDAKIANARTFSVAVEPPVAGVASHETVDSAFKALARVLPTWQLNWVYRAVDEDLILQLSKNYYDGGLRRLPDGSSVTGLDRSILVEYIPDGTGLPGADHEGVESVTAEVNRVVDLVFEHARLRPRTSLAVVTASLRHAARIGEAIRLQLPNHPLLSAFFGAGPESFRVVDLERAQGLVRDHVIFSLGYGRTPHGRALHSFGPLSTEGGRNRFALAMTRARRSMHVLSCFRPEDLDLDRLAHGAVDFYELLDRELSGNSNLGTPASRAVASEQALGEDPLVADLGERLRARGARVWHLYDGVLDIAAAADPVHTIGREGAEIPTPVAIESDGTERYRRMSVRERSRLRPQLLERMGWRYMSLWTIEVFTDPSSCADRIGSYLGLENHVPQAVPPAEHGFLDMDVEQLNLDNAASSYASSSYSSSPHSSSSASSSSYSRASHRQSPGGAQASVESQLPGQAGVDNRRGPGGEPGNAEASTPTPSDPEDGTEAPVKEQGTGNESGSDEQTAAVSAENAKESAETKTPAAKQASGGILPTKAAEDDPRRWGDEGNYDHEQWLKEQKPPHWG
ncbi:hypothetical protein StoSoilB13_15960 [Arthrobacter sp. StoSoilB13]|nr:hypothetical protein StoSoilB13_15960 [Arthrobacter sp. StoSoilB13]